MAVGIQVHGPVRFAAAAENGSTNVQLVSARPGLVFSGWAASNESGAVREYRFHNGTSTSAPVLVRRGLSNNASEVANFEFSGVLSEDGIFLQRDGNLEVVAYYFFLR